MVAPEASWPLFFCFHQFPCKGLLFPLFHLTIQPSSSFDSPEWKHDTLTMVPFGSEQTVFLHAKVSISILQMPIYLF